MPPLSRGSPPPQRYPIVEIHHPRALPARVMLRPRTYHVPRRLAPSTISLVFHQVRSRGWLPSELDRSEIVRASRRVLPSCDSLDLGHAFECPWHAGSPRRGFASGVWALCRLGRRPADFSTGRRPGSPGVLPPWGFPLSIGLGPHGQTHPSPLRASCVTPPFPSAPSGFRHRRLQGVRSALLSGTSG